MENKENLIRKHLEERLEAAINKENLTDKVSFDIFKKTPEEREALKQAKKAHKQTLQKATASIKLN